MMLTLHIIVALGSILVASAAYLRPSIQKLKAAYFLTSIMLGSGTYLLIRNTSHLFEACIVGLIFLSVVTFEIVSAKRKLASDASNLL